MRTCLITTLTLLLALPGAASGSPAREQTAAAAAAAAAAKAGAKAALQVHLERLNRAFDRVNRQMSGRAKLVDRMGRYQKLLEATRAQPAGPARDYRIRRLLAESRALSKKLTEADRTIRRAELGLARARKRLLSHLDTLRGDQRARVRRELARTRAQSQGGRTAIMRVAQPRIHPLDGPREIDEKADVLADSEEKIRKRLAEIDGIIGRMKKRLRLRAVSRGVDRYTGLFPEDSAGRRLTRTRAVKPAEQPSAGEQGSGPGATTPTDPQDGNMESDLGSFNGTAPADDYSDPSRSVSSPGTYAVVFRDLLTPATLQALKEAGRSSDPGVRLRALERARAELRRRARALKQRAARYRRKARSIRSIERKRHK